jgi:hypothetical protein
MVWGLQSNKYFFHEFEFKSNNFSYSCSLIEEWGISGAAEVQRQGAGVSWDTLTWFPFVIPLGDGSAMR